MARLSHQNQGRHGYHTDSRDNQNNLMLIELWHWLVGPSVSGSEIDKKPTKLLT